MEDEQLIRAYQAGKKQALDALITKHLDGIYRWLRYYGIRGDDAEDLAQEVCIALINGLLGFRFNGTFEAFLSRIIRNQVIDFWRKRGNKNKVFIVLFAEDEEDESIQISKFPDNNMPLPDHDINHEELLKAIAFCLSRITSYKIKVLVQNWLNCILNGECLTRKQMATLLGVTLGYVNGTLERAKTAFRVCIKAQFA